jgi:molecular chaperone GrpE
MSDRHQPHQFVISQSQQQQTIAQVGLLLKERLSLQQALANRLTTTTANSEQLFLELLEIFDALESLQEYFAANSQLTERAIERIPKSIGTIQSKLLGILAKRQVEKIAIDDLASDSDSCQIVDTQIDSSVTAPTITKVVRQGFKIGECLLRPVEVTIATPSQRLPE